MIDNLTGLIWLKNANCFGPSSWTKAIADANALETWHCGLGDGSSAGEWRLPNVRELQSLLHYGVSQPALPNTTGTAQWAEGDPFTGVVSSGYYWTSTDFPANPLAARCVNSIAVAPSSSGTSVPLHEGHERPHPAPDPVARTSAPSTITTTLTASVTIAKPRRLFIPGGYREERPAACAAG